MLPTGQRDSGRNPDSSNAAAGRERSCLQLRPVLRKLYRAAIGHHGLALSHRRIRSEAETRVRFDRRRRRQEDRQEREIGCPGLNCLIYP